VLSELGVVGLVLLVAALVLLVAAAVGNPFSRRGDPLHPLLVALQAATIAFIVHMTGDWDWDMAAIGTLAFVFLAACASYRATRAADERRAARDTSVADEPGELQVDEAALEPAFAAAESPEPVFAMAAASQATVYSAASVSMDPSFTESSESPEPAFATTSFAADASSLGEEGDVPDGEKAHPGSRRGRRVGWGPRTVASLALVLLAVCWLPPYLAFRAQNTALAEATDGRVEAALVHVRRAARLDPLAVEPLLTEARLLQQLGRSREALQTIKAAGRLQPQNYKVWFALGELQQGVFGKVKAARAAFNRALALNPTDALSRTELDRLGH
jgi:tetratricopeptide (TPR) repeat protein